MSDCSRCGTLYDEMLVLKSQLVDAKHQLESSRREPTPPTTSVAGGGPPGAAQAAYENRPSLPHYQPFTTTAPRLERSATPENLAAPPTPPAEEPAVHMSLMTSNPSTFPFRYVPPHEFLPAPFVEAHLDWLIILDRYAQLFHAHHVAAPMVTSDDPAVLRSTVTLLQLKVKQLEHLLEQARSEAEAAKVAAANAANVAAAMSFQQHQQQSQSTPRSSRHSKHHHHHHQQHEQEQPNANEIYASTHRGLSASGAGGGVDLQHRPPRVVDDPDADGSDPNSPAGSQPPQTRTDRIEKYRRMKRAQTPPTGYHGGGSRRSSNASAAGVDDDMQQQQQQQQQRPSATPSAAASTGRTPSPALVVPPHLGERRNSNPPQRADSTVPSAAAAGTGATPSASASATPTATSLEQQKDKPPTVPWNNIFEGSPEQQKQQQQPAAAAAAAAAPVPAAAAAAADTKKEEAAAKPSASTGTKDENLKSAVSARAALFANTEEKPLPPDWAERPDPKTGKPYFYNRKTKETSWKRPSA